jgi:Ala-tRNA(Pro) deacylase
MTKSTVSGGHTGVCRFLTERGIDYTLTEHGERFTAAAEARASGVDLDRAAKAVVLRDDDGYCIAIIPASERLDLARARRVLGRHALRLATEAELGADFAAFELGAIPPLGELLGVDAILDPRLPAHGQVLCNAGDHRHSLVLDARDLARLGGFRIGSVVELDDAAPAWG